MIYHENNRKWLHSHLIVYSNGSRSDSVQVASDSQKFHGLVIETDLNQFTVVQVPYFQRTIFGASDKVTAVGSQGQAQDFVAVLKLRHISDAVTRFGPAV